MKIAVLDAATLGEDLSLSPLRLLGEVVTYALSPAESVAQRLADCEVAVLNKVKITADVLEKAPSLRLICIAATGYDNVDIAACRTHHVAVCNVAGYSTHSVAQVTLALALALITHLPEYTACVRSGAYTASGIQNQLQPVYHELCGRTWGIVGLGHIGRQVARVADAMGCRVLAFRRQPDAEFPCVDLDTLCRESDIISLHLPLCEETRGCISRERIAQMKPTTLVINMARGAVVDEAALAQVVAENRIGGLGCDVYSAEPMAADHPFQAIRERENVLLTPHMAWGAYEARERCLREIAENIRAFYRGEQRSRIDL